MEPAAVELGLAEEVPGELVPERRMGEPPPAPEAPLAGRAPAARTTTAMQARFGNARTARLMSESALTEARAGTTAQAPAPLMTMAPASAAAPAADLATRRVAAAAAPLPAAAPPAPASRFRDPQPGRSGWRFPRRRRLAPLRLAPLRLAPLPNLRLRAWLLRPAPLRRA